MISKVYHNDIEQRQPVSNRAAIISACRTYRYVLYREIESRLLRPDNRKIAAFVGLNPSTADGFTDDPTIRKCIGFCKRWEVSDLLMLNLFAYRATDPKALKQTVEPRGPHNDSYLRRFTERADLVVCCWGANVDGWIQPNSLTYLCEHIKGSHYCLGLTGSGQPRHPLMLAYTTELQTFSLMTE
jgi:hypothetical protein